MSFLLSNGRVSEPLTVPDQMSLKALFDRYFHALPTGSLEKSTIYTMKVHRRSLEGHFGKSKLVESIDPVALQEYIDKRSSDPGHAGTLSPTTIRKEVVTLGTVWNWAKYNKLVQGDFPIRGLKYPKGKEKPPYMPFQDILRRTKTMSGEEAAELWECAFLTQEELVESCCPMSSALPGIRTFTRCSSFVATPGAAGRKWPVPTSTTWISAKGL